MGIVWRATKIPSRLFERIEKVYAWFGYRSVAEYIRAQLIPALERDELKIELSKDDVEHGGG